MSKRTRAGDIRTIAIFIYEDVSGAIGYQGGLPNWQSPVPKEARQFIQETIRTVEDPKKKNAIVVGGEYYRVYFDDIGGGRRKIVKECLNCVLSKTESLYSYNDDEAIITRVSPEKLFTNIQDYGDEIETIYVLGGASTFQATFDYWTDIYAIQFDDPKLDLEEFDYDHRIPNFKTYFREKEEDEKILAKNLKLRHFVRVHNRGERDNEQTMEEEEENDDRF